MSFKKTILIMVLVCFFTVSIGGETILAQSNTTKNGSNFFDSSIFKTAVIVITGFVGYWLLAELAKENYESHFKNGKACYEKGEIDQALCHLEQAKRCNDTPEVNDLLQIVIPKYQEIHYTKGVAFDKSQQWKDAYDQFEQVLKYGEYKDSYELIVKDYEELIKINTKIITVLRFSDNVSEYKVGSRIPNLFEDYLLSKHPRFINIVEGDYFQMVTYRHKFGISDPNLVSTKDGFLPGSLILISGTVQSAEVNYKKEKTLSSSSNQGDVYNYFQQKTAHLEVNLKLMDAETGLILVNRSFKSEKSWTYKSTTEFSRNVISNNSAMTYVLNEVVNYMVSVVYSKFEIVPNPAKIKPIL